MDRFNEYLTNSINTTFKKGEKEELLSKLYQFKADSECSITKKKILDLEKWNISKEKLFHESNKFFSINKYCYLDNEILLMDQPEIGFLGMICRENKNKLEFLLQFKIEPGNINQAQLSPTLQATKSNFMQIHGGRSPEYLECFKNLGDRTEVIFDLLQTEQSSFFYKKYNRNMLIMIMDESVFLKSSKFHWLTMGQIYELLSLDNIINMDTRSLLSCIKFN